MAYARKTSTRRSSTRARSGSRRRSAAPRRAAPRRSKSGVRRSSAGRSGGTVRIVIEHQAMSDTQRPSLLQATGDTKAPKRAKF